MLFDTYQIMAKIMHRLFVPEQRRLDKMIEDLTNQNDRIKKRKTYGFMHMGQVFVSEVNKEMFKTLYGGSRNNSAIPTISIELIEQVADFMGQQRQMENDQNMIKQVLFKLVAPANTIQEFRDALPECVVQILSGTLRDMPRTVTDPTYLIQDDWRSIRDYKKVISKIEFYAMTSIIY